MNANTYPCILLGLIKCKSIFTFTHVCIWEFLIMWMQSEFAYVYFCSLGCCDWCWMQHLLFFSTATAYLNYMRVGDEVSTPKLSTVPKCLLCQNMPKCLLCQNVPKCLLCQNVFCAKMSTPKITNVAKCLLCQNVYYGKMSTPKMSAWPKCLLCQKC